MDKLFLFEVVINKIDFLHSYLNHSKADVIITAIFGNVFRLDIQLDKTNESYQTLYAGEMNFNCGKSYLFSCMPDALQDAFDIYPLELIVSMEGEPVPVGSATIPWSNDFNTLLTLAQTEDTVSPVYVRNAIDIRSANKTKTTGVIHYLIRLCYFGTNIQTSFEVKSERAGKKYLFKSTGGDTKFQMQKCGSGTSADMIPVGSLFTDDDFRHNILGSLDPVFIQNSSPPQSLYNVPAPQHRGPMIQISSDILSLIVRPDEKEFFNVFEIGKVTSDQIGASTELLTEPKELTVEEIQKQLCNDPGCPGTQKFIELGIHPLAKNKNLGGIMGPTDIPLDYGLSQTYGVMERYGPYGYYAKPKCLEESIARKKFCEKCCKDYANKKIKQTSHNQQLGLNGGGPLRLRGGGIEDDYEEFPQPMAACKDLMDDFDKLLVEYKKAMGPCGKATCPFAGTIIQENCKNLCKHSMDNMDTVGKEETNKSKKEEGVISACGTEECPYSRQPYTKVEEQFKAKQLKPACGAATCPYTKQKIEMGLDGEAFAKTCGSPKCPGLIREFLPPLEPVHWDCPDPLPKGLCKNPDCPYLPKELKVFKPRKGPCGGISCPYAPPPWCGSPVCPFGPPRPCPFVHPSPPKKEENKTCPLPDCPFMNQWPGHCDNPQCPFKELTAMMYEGNNMCGGQKPQPQQNDDFCGNPECSNAPKTPSGVCVFAENKNKKQEKVCDNPVCPYANQTSNEDYCSDPKCPNKPKTEGDSGDSCPFAATMNDICDNPDCPFLPNKIPSPCFIPDSSGESPCPYAFPLSCYHPCLYPFLPPCAYKPPITCGIPDCPYDNIATCPQKPPGDDSSSSSSSSNRSKSRPSNVANEQEQSPETIYVSCNRFSSNDPCLPTTCGADGGEFECEECLKDGVTKSAPALGGNEKKTVTRKSKSDKRFKKEEKKKKKKGKYVYSIGDKYPGVHVGHRECCSPFFRVPPKMGWLWNIPCPFMKSRRGWRPGAVGRTIAKRIYECRKAKGMIVCDALTTQSSKRRRGYRSESDITVTPKPTLQIKKKDGVYLITMNPLKDPKTLAENENPYMDCTPLQFKIVKNKDKEKMVKGEEGGNDMKTCYCEEYDFPASSSSDSELDIEFTPPAGIIRPERLKKKKNVVHTETQYNPEDCMPDKLKVGKAKDEGKDKGKGKKEKKGGKKGKKK